MATGHIADRRRVTHARRGHGLLWLALIVSSLLVARDAPARALRHASLGIETPILVAAAPHPRVTAWAVALPAIEVVGTNPHSNARVRLYADDGAMDEDARAALERVAANDGPPHALTPRVEQLLVRVSHHFGDARVFVVSAFRERAGRHGTGDAIDFKLQGVRPRLLAAYLRGLARVGVGIYTHPKTQFVHLDVREQSFHWIDASPPGVKWREGRLRDPGAAKRDAAWTPESDLPLD